MLKWILIYLALHHVLLFSQNADINLLRKINLNRNKSLDKTFTFLTDSRSAVSLGIFAGIATYGILYKDSLEKQHAISLGLSLLTAAAITHTIKYVVHRDRPYITYPEIEKLSSGGSYSFPSGHTSEAFSTATTVSIEYPHWYIIAPAALWATSVAYSRMHLGVHYPSDVVGGMLTGVGSAFLAHWLTKKIRRKTVCHDSTNN